MGASHGATRPRRACPATGAPALAEDGMKVWEARNDLGVDARCEHAVLIFDGAGTLIDSWNQC